MKCGNFKKCEIRFELGVQFNSGQFINSLTTEQQ